MSAIDDEREVKKALRRECFAAVRGLSDSEKAESSSRICNHLRESAVFSNTATSIGIYIAVKSEPDLSDLIWNSHGKSFSLARIGEDEMLHFHRISSEADLVIGEFGIAEPNPLTCPAITESEIDVVLVPGVAFDPDSGARLGRGKGHYDRFLEKLRSEEDRKCPVIGVSFGIQHRSVNAESHDQPMDGLVTESELIAI